LWPAATIPTIRVAGRFPLAERAYATTYLGRTHALHVHAYCGEIRIGERTFSLQDGDLTVSPAGIPSAYDLRQSGHHLCVHFLPAGNAPRAGLIALPLHLPLRAASSYARERLAHISRLHARSTHGGAPDLLSAASAAIALQELLLWCAARSQVHAGVETPTPDAIERIAAILDTRFHEQLSVPRLAAKVGTSQNSIARRFRQRFGMTIPHYVSMRRIGHARYLLESTDLPIGRIAERVGIPDPQYFNKQVRRLLGDSPSAIRNAAQRSRRIR
ncbi:MAG: helix-turn-helix domain-containing protein, partial [Steroidobacteraceae bacterium]